VDVTRMPLWWRRELIGFLPADPGFLRGTLAENVRFGRSVEAVPNADEAIRLAGVDRIAATRQEAGGMHAPIRDPMEELSNGQRRRIGIARVLAGRQRCLIYDEPGSQLDPRSMTEIADAIAGAAHARTSIVITHDPDVFRTDFNVFLAGGGIADVGPHAELLGRNAAYRELVAKLGEERARPRAEIVTGAFPPRLGTPGREGGKTKASIPVS
jgi:ABC-type multidrug transport system fused ATPase/permease subunit